LGRHALGIIVGFLLVAVLSANYLGHHFAITTDSSRLSSSSLPWRQQEIKLDRAFPQRTDQIIAVIDATTPEGADEAADALVNELSPRSEMIRSISRPDGGEFFAKNGVLFLTVDELRRDTAEPDLRPALFGYPCRRSDAAPRSARALAGDRGGASWKIEA
jgi:uncharacterized protein